MLTVRVFLPSSKYNAAQALRFYRSGLEHLAALPGVQSASVGTCLPVLNNCMMAVRFDLEGSGRGEADRPSVFYSAVGAQYFEMLRIRLMRGRFFTEADNENAPPVAIVSETLAARYFPNEDPIGKRIVVSRPLRFSGRGTGEAGDCRRSGEREISRPGEEPKPMIYAPHAQNPYSRGVWFAVRTAGNPAALASAVRGEFLAIDKEEPVEQVGTLDQMLESQLAQPRFQTGLMGSFALVALLLAVLGIYGVNAYAVVQRRNELGLRMALGATRGSVLRLVIWQGMLPTGIGIVLGVAGAAGATTLLRSVLVGADTLDPIAFLGAAAVLAAAAALACYFPARRATRIDPAIILRLE